MANSSTLQGLEKKKKFKAFPGFFKDLRALVITNSVLNQYWFVITISLLKRHYQFSTESVLICHYHFITETSLPIQYWISTDMSLRFHYWNFITNSVLIQYWFVITISVLKNQYWFSTESVQAHDASLPVIRCHYDFITENVRACLLGLVGISSFLINYRSVCFHVFIVAPPGLNRVLHMTAVHKISSSDTIPRPSPCKRRKEELIRWRWPQNRVSFSPNFEGKHWKVSLLPKIVHCTKPIKKNILKW